MLYPSQFDINDVLCPIPWWWRFDLPRPHRTWDDVIRYVQIPELRGDYVPVRDDPRPPVATVTAIRDYISVAASLAAAESEVERAHAMIRQLGTAEGIQRFASVGGLTDQPLEPGEPLRGPGWRWPIQKLVAAALFEAGLVTLDADFAQVLHAAANEAANL